MKSLNPKDRTKLIALISVALVAFLYSAFQMNSYDSAQKQMIAKAEAAKKTPKNPAGATSVAAVSKPAGITSAVVTPGSAPGALPGALPSAPGTPGTGGTAGTPGTSGVVTDTSTLAGALASLGPAALLPPTGGKDPFIPTGHFAEEQVKATAPSAPALPAAAALTPVKLAGLPSGGSGSGATIKETLPGGVGLFPGLAPGSSGGGVGGMGGMGGVNGGPVIVETPPPPTFTLTGIIVRDASDSGSNGPGDKGTIAVLHGGNTTSPNARFVSVGDPVGNGYQVAAVRSNAVDLKNGSHVVTLKMETEDK